MITMSRHFLSIKLESWTRSMPQIGPPSFSQTGMASLYVNLQPRQSVSKTAESLMCTSQSPDDKWRGHMLDWQRVMLGIGHTQLYPQALEKPGQSMIWDLWPAATKINNNPTQDCFWVMRHSWPFSPEENQQGMESWRNNHMFWGWGTCWPPATDELQLKLSHILRYSG